MPAQNWRKNTALVEALKLDPNDVPFFQLVRILERAAYMANRGKTSTSDRFKKNPVGLFTPPNQEIIRFQSSHSLGFPGSEVSKIDRQEQDNQSYWDVLINFMGLTGASGILPFHYSEMMFKRIKLKDYAMQHALDMFNHRSVSLFFKASVKYRLPLAYERYQLIHHRSSKPDAHTHALLSFIGLGTEHLTDQLTIPADSLIFFAGLMSQQTRPASALRQMISHYFDVPIEIHEFTGEWHDLIDDVRSRLPTPEQPKGQNACLGKSAILGGKGWFSQGKLRIVLGPLNAEQFKRFAPGTKNLKTLNEVTKMYAGTQTECEYILRVARDDLPHRIQLKQRTPPTVGWDTWLASKPRQGNENRGTMDIRVSSGRLNH